MVRDEMIGKDKHRVSVTLTKTEMGRARKEAKRRKVRVAAYLSSMIRETWATVDRFVEDATEERLTDG
jgi:hypothetical protein